MLRRKLQRYAIITSIILVILLVATVTTYAFQKDQKLTNPQLMEDYSYTLIDNTSFNFSTIEFESINYNSSMTVVDVLSIDDSLTSPPNLIMIYGSKENTTGFQHGFIELYAVSQVGYQAALQKVAGFLDASPDNETVFQKGCYFINNINDLFFYMLKQKGPDYFIDILAYQNQHLELNASIPINSLLLEETWDFAVMDKEPDKLVNLFLVGQNQTTHKISLVEFQLNVTTTNMNYIQSFSWDFQGKTFVDLQTTLEADAAYFYLCSVGTSPALYTSMTVFSVQKTLGSSLTLVSNNSYTYGGNSFRAYSTKFLSRANTGHKQLALFGTLIIDGVDSYPYCLILSYTNGVPTAAEGIQLEQTPSWCLTGFIADLNYDSERELVLFTYDFVYHQRSEFTLLSNTTKQELTSGLYSFSQVKSSALLTIEGLSISAILAKDSSQNDVLIFHKLGFTPFKLRANSELLQINALNSLLLESYGINGTPITVSNAITNFAVHGVVNLDTTITIMPSIITLEIPSVAHSSDLLQFSIDIFQNSFVIYSKTFYVSLGYVPKITVIAPGSPIAIRLNESKTEIFEFLVNNQLPVTLIGEISIISSQRTKTTQINCLPAEETEIGINFNFAKPVGTKQAVENLSILIKTQIGTFRFQYAVVVSTGLTIGYMDLTAITVTLLLITTIGYLAFVFAISRETEESLEAYYLLKEPKKLEFKRFEKQAQRHLLQKCLQNKNWQVGLELAKARYPEYVAKFLKFKADEQLLMAQKLLQNGEFIKGLSHLESAREALEMIRSKPIVELLDGFIIPLKKLLDAIEHMKGLEKVAMLKDAFQKLLRLRKKKEEEKKGEEEAFSLKEFPFYLIAKELAVAFKENGDLENALNFLQIAYQDAPNGKKNDIVLEITDLIRLGLKPKELTIPDDFEVIKERLKNKKIMCFNCGFKYFDSEPTCPQCGTGTVKCSVCKLPISFGSLTLECPHCHTIAHQEHLLEWIKVKGTCPVCQQKLKLDEFSPITQT
ncbi:MAG: hypothetical protein ACTSVS_13175 [Candidatus Heimdallarchaeota archaeon]